MSIKNRGKKKGREGRKRGLAVFLLFHLEDVGGALVAGQKIHAVIAFQKGLQRFHTRHQTHQIVFIAQTEHRVDQIVTNAFFLQRHFQPVGEEG